MTDQKISQRPSFTMKHHLHKDRASYDITADGVIVGVAARKHRSGFRFLNAWEEDPKISLDFKSMRDLQDWVACNAPVEFVEKTGEVSANAVKHRAYTGLRKALERQRPDVTTDERGYVEDFRLNLLPQVCPEDFVTDLRSGGGNELRSKFRAAHSSAAFAVNCFAPFRRQIADLTLPEHTEFDCLRFEGKCPTGLDSRQPPNLDALLSGPAGILGIESKLTEFLGGAKPWESIEKYVDHVNEGSGEHWGESYIREMHHLREDPKHYKWLDAAQLIKHAFGLAHSFRDRDDPITLLYLFWEPENPERCPEVFEEHRREIEEFAKRVAGSKPAFEAMSYPKLWRYWRENAPDQWLSEHLDQLEERYLIRI